MQNHFVEIFKMKGLLDVDEEGLYWGEKVKYEYQHTYLSEETLKLMESDEVLDHKDERLNSKISEWTPLDKFNYAKKFKCSIIKSKRREL